VAPVPPPPPPVDDPLPAEYLEAIPNPTDEKFVPATSVEFQVVPVTLANSK
jgi:hypothetical protein